MSVLLPSKDAPKIRFRKVVELDSVITEHDLTVLLIHEKCGKSLLKQCLRSPELIREYQRLNRYAPVTSVRLNANEDTGIILCIFVKNSVSSFERLRLAAKAWKEVAGLGCQDISIATLGLEDQSSIAWLNAQLTAILAGAAHLPSYKQKPSPSPLQSITLVSDAPATVFAQTLATQQGNHLARWFTTLPPNQLTCGNYRQALLALAKQQGWQHEFLNVAALKKHKAGAFLAVARANSHADAGILRLSYRAVRGKRNAHNQRTLALVGKGICFDTGGINLKSHKSMYDMHTDMQGSAVAVGTLLALTRLKAPYDIDCWLALTENEIGPNAYRPQEVVTAFNGVTIQVVHSDAEGRMALADTLSLAARSRPDLIIDFATLTGACVAALTERMSGAFTNRDSLRSSIETAGRDSGERVWSFPMDEDFDSDLDSPIADLMQCTMDNKGDHILAARFLNHFVPGRIPWIHIDLSSGNRTGGLAHVPTEITGFGVRWAVQFMQQHSFAAFS